MEDLLQKYHANKKHALVVQKFSLMLFDAAKELSLHDLSSKKRKILEIAALLHDIGYFVDSKGHNKHSAALIMQENFEGLDEEDKLVIACIARYHRGSLPKEKHETYASLPKKKRKTVQKLGGILRIADGLDRSRFDNIKDLDFDYNEQAKIFEIRVIPDSSAFSVDLSAVICKKELFEKAFGVQAIVISG